MIVRIEHVIACGGCATGMKKFMLSHGLSKNEVRIFFKEGMSIEAFKERFEQDPRCAKVIERAIADVEEKKTNGRL